MQITRPSTTTASLQLPRVAQQLGSAHHFSQLLSTGDAATDRAPKPKDSVARQAAEDLVGITLVKPLLEQVRQDPFQTELFHGGFAEDAFGAQLDSIIAQRVTQSARLPIVEAVYNQIVTAHNKVNTHG